VGGLAVTALAVNGTDLYVGGFFTTTGSLSANYTARWNPLNCWSALGNGLNNAVEALGVSGSTVFAGGIFTEACGNPACNSGNTTANRVAAWNGSSWSALGSGTNDDVPALVVNGSDQYVEGRFTTAGAKPSVQFARWNKSFLLYLPLIRR
jgi:trimeric autotransporter adhesin